MENVKLEAAPGIDALHPDPLAGLCGKRDDNI